MAWSWHKFSNVLHVLSLICKFTRALTFEGFFFVGQNMHMALADTLRRGNVSEEAEVFYPQIFYVYTHTHTHNHTHTHAHTQTHTHTHTHTR
jgi:hypothetical protein